MKRVRKGDFVEIISGKDKGRSGQVVQVFPKTDHCIVEGAGKVKKHQKASQAGGPSGIVEKSMKIHLSNVMPVDSKTKKPSRVRLVVGDKEKKRVYARSGKEIEIAAKA